MEVKPGYDFSGWVTRNNIKCADGRTIKRDAFAEQDGTQVPMCWGHNHDDPNYVLGHVLLENRDDGVYGYGYFNNSDLAKVAKESVRHKDVSSMSIYANKLKQKAGDVYHGVIREVSLVLASANPGAYIDCVNMAHSATDEVDDFEAEIYFGETIELAHSDDKTEEKATNENPAESGKGEEDMAESEKTVKDVYDAMTEEQKTVVKFMIGAALQNAGKGENDDDEGEDNVKHNLFENDTPRNSLSHEDVKTIISDAKRIGSLKEAINAHMEDGVLAHALYNDNGTEQTYGVANIDYLFPEPKLVNNGAPDFIQREQDWVKVIMNGVHRTPFSRIKSQFANITMDEARARGYMKGNRKKEEVFSLLKRTTDPQTIYKKQKLDRDDVIDITDFDIVAWIKSEMRVMLDEEAARAILLGDGRLSTDEDKIDPNHIRPIFGEDDLYAFKVHVTAGQDDSETAKNVIRAVLKNRKTYKGSGNLTWFTSEDYLSDMLLLEDGFGHSLYKTETELATKLRVNRIVTCPLMENFRVGNERLVGIAVDLKDYNVGADKGGSVSMFDDFDIDFNQMKYLIEGRFSGALIKPYSAMVVVVGGSAPTYTEATVTAASTPKASGWYVKEGDIYILTKDETPLVIGEDDEENPIYRTYYVKS